MQAHLRLVAFSSVIALLGLLPAEASAARNTPGTRCLATIAKAANRYLKGRVTLERSCREASLRGGCGTCTGGGNGGEDCSQTADCPDDGPGTGCAGVACAAPDAAALATLESNLVSAITRRCDLGVINLARLGFPGQCSDADSGDGFTVGDLAACIRDSHTALLHGVCSGATNAGEACSQVGDCPNSGPGTACLGLLGIEYDRSVCDLDAGALACQREIGRSGLRFLLKVLQRVQRCRNELLTGKLTGVEPARCALDDAKTRDAIAKAKARAEKSIAGKCDGAGVTAVAACTPNQTTVSGAACDPSVAGCSACVGTAQCETCWHQTLADNPLRNDVADLIDFEYATPGSCGDGILNQRDEECDGAQDGACPGQCGDPNGFFPCICQNVPRQRVIEHRDADLDLGFSGFTHDAHVVEGGGFVADLYDCQGSGGPDTLCTVGPSCSGGDHSPCSPGANEAVTGDSICQALGEGTCRRTRVGSQGRHCEIDFDRRCVDFNDCAIGEACVENFHGAPLPLSAGGTSVCSVNYFTEDVTGTTNLATGESSVRIRQRSVTYGPGDLAQPCPVCGGFCEGQSGMLSPGKRRRCSVDTDCPEAPHRCVTANVCSYGPNQDQPCRPNPPFGGATAVFGNPSVDCLPAPGTNISGPGLDIVFDPATTGAVSRVADSHCVLSPGFTGKACIGGPEDGRPCTLPADCPLGVCNEQCFCPSVGTRQSKPNACLSACKGGGNDAAPCGEDSECPGGFCHNGDCRVDPADHDSCQEGICTSGPIQGFCAQTTYRSCSSDAGCQTPACPDCQPGETCTLVNRACFPNGTIERCGSPGVPDRTTATIFCIPAVTAETVNIVSGLPGAGALTQPITTIEVGF